MARYIICILIIWGCSNSPAVENETVTKIDTLPNTKSGSFSDNIIQQNILNDADSVILASHYSPNEPIKDERTGKYLPNFKLIEDGKLNPSIVQERKRLNQKDITELSKILFARAGGDSEKLSCFQPRNGIFVYKSGKLSYIDICFACQGLTISGNWGSNIIFDDAKYEKLLAFYTRHGFEYVL